MRFRMTVGPGHLPYSREEEVGMSSPKVVHFRPYRAGSTIVPGNMYLVLFSTDPITTARPLGFRELEYETGEKLRSRPSDSAHDRGRYF